MISVVCVYNNERTLRNVLLKSLEPQTVPYELLALDNRRHTFRSAAEALNRGGVAARGDYIMFVHQDMWLSSPNWLRDVEETLGSLPRLGVAGVAGMSETGKTWRHRSRSAIDEFTGDVGPEATRITEPEEVQTLDECLLIVPGSVFQRLRFDETAFDGWDCYGADYCLSAARLGLAVYVIPAPSAHSCLRARRQAWEFVQLVKYQKRLYAKHGKNLGRIHTWMGTITWWNLKYREALGVLGPLYLRLFPSFETLLDRELAGCDTVLDLGCGHHSPLVSCSVPSSVGVELFEPSLRESARKGIHSQYIRSDIRTVEFKPKSFDAVIAVEVLEHLTKQEGAALLAKMAQWAKKKVIVTTPNGYLQQDTYDNNPLQQHRSGWAAEELRDLGFKVRGIAGWKALRGYRGSIRFRPAFLWARVSDVTQRLTYYCPGLAFQLLAVKRIGGVR